MKELRKRKDLAPEFPVEKNGAGAGEAPTRLLTSRNSELCVAPLDVEHFLEEKRNSMI
ncbi:MAG: hypothetical protein V8S22_10595 [Lachnospiraceae bacterium]